MQNTKCSIQNANHKPQTAKYILTMLQVQAEHEEK